MNEQLTFFHFVFKATDAALQNNPLLGTLYAKQETMPLAVPAYKSPPWKVPLTLPETPWWAVLGPSGRIHFCRCPVLHGFWVPWADTGSRSPSPPLVWGDERFGQHVTVHRCHHTLAWFQPGTETLMVWPHLPTQARVIAHSPNALP